MWSTEHTSETSVAPATIWTALRDLHTGARVGGLGDAYAIHGPFAVGTEMTVRPAGQDEAFTSRIVELVDGRVYADETEFDGLVLRNRHTIAGPASGRTTITHRLEIDGPSADSVGPTVGPKISEDFPAAMDDLIAAAASAQPQPS